MTTSRPTSALAACALALAITLAAWAMAAGLARAETYGELAIAGKFGTEKGKFKWPAAVAADPTDNNSVYVLDEPAGEVPGMGPTSFRIQKFAATLGAPTAEVTVPTPEVGGRKQYVSGIAVDPVQHRLYVLKTVETACSEHGKYVGSEIDAYSTSESAGSLPAAPGVETGGKAGVLYEFPTISSCASIPAGTLREPDGLAVDSSNPSSVGIVAIGADAAHSTLLQRIAASGASGALTEEFDDTAGAVVDVGSVPTGVAVGPEGAVYLSAHVLSAGGGTGPGVVKLTGKLGSAPTVTVVHKGDSGSIPPLTGGKAGLGHRDFGDQVAVSADGSLVYAFESSKPEPNAETGGEYEVRGMSTAAGPDLGAQEVVFGGGSTSCLIASEFNAVAAGSGGVVYALDEGSDFENESEEFVPTSFGFHLVKFGPGGTGCPAPTTSFKVAGDASSETVDVQKGQEVKFEASTTELHGEQPTELVWEAEGPEAFKTEVKGAPAALATTHKFLKPGSYTVTLTMQVSPGSYGPPGVVHRKVQVTAPPPVASFTASAHEPKSGQSVTFNGAESLDPTGSATGGPTNHLKSYRWSFGDGQGEETTTTPEYTRSFTNTSTKARQETVTLVVINEEGVESAPTTENLTIQGVETPPSGGGGGGGSGSSPGTTSSTPTPTPSVGSSPPPVLPVKPLTAKQKLAKALQVCRKIKAKRRRLSCEAQAKKRYGPKPKPKRKKSKH